MSIKGALRDAAKAVRKDLHGSDLHGSNSHGADPKAGERAAAVLAGLPLAKTLARRKIFAGYMPIATEFDPQPIMDLCVGLGLQGALPVVNDAGALEFQAWSPDVKLARGGFSIFVPTPPTPVVQPDLLFVPLLAVDRKGWRIGYGAGYYDSALRRIRKHSVPPPIVIGVCFDGQLVNTVPHHDGDERLDWILTETQIIETQKNQASKIQE